MRDLPRGEQVTVWPPHNSPHMECNPHVHVVRQVGDGYMVSTPTMILGGKQLEFGPYPRSQMTLGWDFRVGKL